LREIEKVYPGPFNLFDYIELIYNRKRIHQTLGYRTPEQIERQWRGA